MKYREIIADNLNKAGLRCGVRVCTTGGPAPQTVLNNR